jgi:hypothetical protein
LSGVSFDSLLLNINISSFSIRFDLGVARTAVLTSRIREPSILLAGRQNRFREPVRTAPFDSMCIQLHTSTMTPATLARRVEAMRRVNSSTRRRRRAFRPAERAWSVRAPRHIAVGLLSGRRRRDGWSASAGGESCDAHSERRRDHGRPRRLRARSRAFFSRRRRSGADGEAISAAARERPLLFLGSTKREWLSGARMMRRIELTDLSPGTLRGKPLDSLLEP